MDPEIVGHRVIRIFSEETPDPQHRAATKVEYALEDIIIADASAGGGEALEKRQPCLRLSTCGHGGPVGRSVPGHAAGRSAGA